MAKIIINILDWVWNLKYFEGRRHKIARGVLIVFALISTYQGSVMSGEIAAQGVYLPLIPGEIMAVLSIVSGYFAGKMKKFVVEHKEP
jgi:hypothetical protein